MRSSVTVAPPLCNGHKRHDAVVQALYQYHHAHYSGAAAAKEPSRLSTEDGRRPDLHIVFSGLYVLTDVVISHPFAPYHFSAASSRPLTTANRAALRKHNKYKQLADTQHAHFLPFSVETSVGMTEDAEEPSTISLTCKDHLSPLQTALRQLHPIVHRRRHPEGQSNCRSMWHLQGGHEGREAGRQAAAAYM
jgi:hypothetical protein